MRKVFKKVVATGLALSMLLGMSACGDKNKAGDTVTAAGNYKSITTTMSMESGTLDSAGITSYWWWSYTSLATAPLVELAADGSYKNILADSYEKWIKEHLIDDPKMTDKAFADEIQMVEAYMNGGMFYE